MAGTLGSFQKVLTQIRTGGGQDDPLFGALAAFGGATGANFDYQNDNSEAIMRKIAANWGKLSKDAQRRFGGMFGFDNATQQGLANGSLVQDADRFAKISKATDEATKKALEFNRRLEEMKQNFSAAAQVLYEALIPYVEKLIPLIEKFGIWISTHGPEISKFFSDTAEEINKVTDAVGGWENALKILLAYVVGSWALGIIAAVGRVAKSFGPLLVAMAAVSAWDKLGNTDDEAKKKE
jgi:phage-related protein